jgi:hypothetical protein
MCDLADEPVILVTVSDMGSYDQIGICGSCHGPEKFLGSRGM